VQVKARAKGRGCQQKHQQRCWKSAGLGSDGVVPDSPAKSIIFIAETTLEATDPRLFRQLAISGMEFSMRRDAACEDLVMAFASSQRGFI
jgi:hypothetical protein